MPKITKDDVRDLLPSKSVDSYEKAWADMEDAIGKRKPTESKLIAYLKAEGERGLGPASLWTLYSKLNANYQIRFAAKLQNDCPNLQRYLKKLSAEGEAPKKARKFTVSEMRQFAHMQPTSGYMLVRQVCAVLSFFGGLRSQETKDIQRQGVLLQPDGSVRVTFTHAKQRQASNRHGEFLVPREWAQQIVLYTNLTCTFPSDTQYLITGDKTRMTFNRKVLGINQVYTAPRFQAEYLALPNPELFTGHSWRRTAAQTLADAGASSSHITRHMGWTSPQMLNTYTAVSQVSQVYAAAVLGGNSQTNDPSSQSDE